MQALNQPRNLDAQLKANLKRLETQKRVALDAEARTRKRLQYPVIYVQFNLMYYKLVRYIKP